VELVRLYSNPPWVSTGLLRLRSDALLHPRSCGQPAPLVPQRVSRRLGTATLAQIAAEYQGGTSSTRLANVYGIGKGTVLRLLRRNGAAIRQRGSRSM
jgi:hypothetical protein